MRQRAGLLCVVLFPLLLAVCREEAEGPERAPSVADDEAEVALDPGESHPALLIPALARDPAPERFQAYFVTTRGTFVLQTERESAPHGVDRLYNLIRIGYFRDVAFYRVVEGFIAQFGVHGDPEINAIWADATIPDDPSRSSNVRGSLSFAQEGPRSRTTQLFINLSDNPGLDSHFTPIARVVEGMSVVDSLYTGYGELAPQGKGPRPALLNQLGNAYLKRQFPEMDYIERVEMSGLR